MEFNPVPFNVGLIDSLTIYLPLNKITVLDSRLTDDFCIYYPQTGLLLDDLNPPKPIIVQSNGINFRFNRVIFPPFKNEPPVTLIRLTITSKMLLSKYFEGINLENIHLITEFINSCNIITVDLETMLNAQTNDIDICINYSLLFEPYKESLYYLKKMVKLSKQHCVNVFPRAATEQINYNYGIMFGSRDSGSVGFPFCKFYNKTNELRTNSVEFYENYLVPLEQRGLNLENIIRKEITIKNSAAKQNLIKRKLVNSDNSLKTLKDVLSINKAQLTTICNIQLKYYFEKKQFVIRADLSPTDKIISYYMLQQINLGADKVTLFEPLILFDEKNQKSRIKKKLIHLIDCTFNTKYLTDILEKNSVANEFIRLQNLW